MDIFLLFFPCCALLYFDSGEMFFTLAAVQLPRWRLASSWPGIPAPNQRGHAWTGARVWEEPLWDRERARLCVALSHFSSQGKSARITLTLAGFRQPDIILMDVASFICLLSCLSTSECSEVLCAPAGGSVVTSLWTPTKHERGHCGQTNVSTEMAVLQISY